MAKEPNKLDDVEQEMDDERIGFDDLVLKLINEGYSRVEAWRKALEITESK